MRLFHPRRIRNSFWPSLAITWAFGGASFGVKHIWRILYAIMMSVIIVLENMYMIGNTPSLEFGRVKIVSYIKVFVTYLRIPSLVISIWWWEFKGARAVENVIVECTKLDEELKNFGLKINHKRFMLRQLIVFGGSVILILTTVILQHSFQINNKKDESGILENNWILFSTTLSLHVQYFQMSIVEIIFAMILEAFRIRFQLVNKVFKRIAESEDQIKVKVFNTSYSRVSDISGGNFQDSLRPAKRHLSSHLVTERIDRACRIHRRLLKVAQEASDEFSSYLCVSSPILITNIMLRVFQLLPLQNTIEEDTLSAGASATSTIFIAARFWLFILSCSNTSDEANKLGIFLYHVPIEDDAIHNQLQEHSVHIVQRKLSFTAGGIFVIDRNLAKSVFSTIMKYLVILLQFRPRN